MSDSPAKLVYVVKFVADMDQAVGFYRDTLGLTLKFQSPDWSEFATGDTILALHLASASKAPGTARIGLSVPDLQAFYAEMSARGDVYHAAHHRGRLPAGPVLGLRGQRSGRKRGMRDSRVTPRKRHYTFDTTGEQSRKLDKCHGGRTAPTGDITRLKAEQDARAAEIWETRRSTRNDSPKNATLVLASISRIGLGRFCDISFRPRRSALSILDHALFVRPSDDVLGRNETRASWNAWDLVSIGNRAPNPTRHHWRLRVPGIGGRQPPRPNRLYACAALSETRLCGGGSEGSAGVSIWRITSPSRYRNLRC
jgi:catechol 2,3-dioxygenase-like lactoylglutathione lyase family enzyme